MGSIWGWGGKGETPAQIFWHICLQKKVVKIVQIKGGGIEVIWTKSKRTATFFRETFPKQKAFNAYVCCVSGTEKRLDDFELEQLELEGQGDRSSKGTGIISSANQCSTGQFTVHFQDFH